MGCRDRESNFQRLVHTGGTWGHEWGAFGIETEDEAVLRSKLEEPPYINYNWSVNYDDTRKRWVAELVDNP